MQKHVFIFAAVLLSMPPTQAAAAAQVAGANQKGSRRDDREQSDRAQDFDHKQQQGTRENAPARPVPTSAIIRLKLVRFDLV